MLSQWASGRIEAAASCTSSTATGRSIIPSGLTEDFQFPTEVEANGAIQDLRSLKPKQLTEQEQALLAEEPNYIEQVVAQKIQAYRDYEHSQAIKDGMQQAARQGKIIGRSRGGATPISG